METLLGVSPGALTPLALLADEAGRVTCVLDASLMAVESLNFHPLINTESTNLSPADLVRFLTSCGHAPLIVRHGRGARGLALLPGGADGGGAGADVELTLGGQRGALPGEELDAAGDHVLDEHGMPVAGKGDTLGPTDRWGLRRRTSGGLRTKLA